MRHLVVIGGGGFGRETLDVVEAINASGADGYVIAGVADDSPSELTLSRLAARNIAWLGAIEAWLDRDGDEHYVVAVGDPRIRARIVDRLTAAARTAATLVHPDAGLGSEVSVGAGTVICAGVQVSTNVTLGRHVHLNPNATVGHDSAIGDFTSVNPGGIVSGDCVVEPHVLVGAGAVLLQGLRAGAGSVIGAAACVTQDVETDTVVAGVPARQLRKV